MIGNGNPVNYQGILAGGENKSGSIAVSYTHLDDDKDTPLLETLETFNDLIKQGKVRAIGASNYGGARLKEALQVSAENNLAAYQCLQPEYNLYAREQYEKELEPICRERNLGVISYYSLASGFLTGKYRSESDLSQSSRGQGVKKMLNPRGYKILACLLYTSGNKRVGR